MGSKFQKCQIFHQLILSDILFTRAWRLKRAKFQVATSWKKNKKVKKINKKFQKISRQKYFQRIPIQKNNKMNYQKIHKFKKEKTKFFSGPAEKFCRSEPGRSRSDRPGPRPGRTTCADPWFKRDVLTFNF